MGIKAVHSVNINFDNVKVPKENLLGGYISNKIQLLLEEGEGFKIAMGILNSGRFGMGALMTAVQRYILKKSVYKIIKIKNKVGIYKRSCSIWEKIS